MLLPVELESVTQLQGRAEGWHEQAAATGERAALAPHSSAAPRSLRRRQHKAPADERGAAVVEAAGVLAQRCHVGVPAGRAVRWGWSVGGRQRWGEQRAARRARQAAHLLRCVIGTSLPPTMAGPGLVVARSRLRGPGRVQPALLASRRVQRAQRRRQAPTGWLQCHLSQPPRPVAAPGRPATLAPCCREARQVGQ